VEFVREKYYPPFYSTYMESLITRLRKADLGCHMGGVFVRVGAYADALLLVSASVVQLQRMLHILCYSHAGKVDI